MQRLREWTGGAPYQLTTRVPFTYPPPLHLKKNAFPFVNLALSALHMQRFYCCVFVCPMSVWCAPVLRLVRDLCGNW